MEKKDAILILGGRGLLGGAVKKLLLHRSYEALLYPTSAELDLLDLEAVKKYLLEYKPKYIFMLAGFVGGILKNAQRQADALYKNTTMILNLLEATKISEIETKILYTASTCVYPRENPQPIEEHRLLAGKLEATNIGYALAKITGIIAGQKYREQYGIKTISCMPTNLYGIGDNYDPLGSHFLASLIRKFLLAKENQTQSITFWGSGEPRREALLNIDCADALINLMISYDEVDIVNIGVGKDKSIKEYVEIMRELTGFTGDILWDKSKPDGTFEKRTDVKKLISIYPGFKPKSFAEGVKSILADAEEVKKILSFKQ